MTATTSKTMFHKAQVLGARYAQNLGGRLTPEVQVLLEKAHRDGVMMGIEISIHSLIREKHAADNAFLEYAKTQGPVPTQLEMDVEKAGEP